MATYWREGLILALTLSSAAAIAVADDRRKARAQAAVTSLEGVWTNAWLTKLERPKDFTTLTIPEAQAIAYDRENAGRVRAPPGKDTVGQEESEWPEVGDQLARIGGAARTSWITDPPDGKIPYTEAAKATNKEAMDAFENVFDHPEQRPLVERCMGVTQSGPPLRNGPDLNVYQIIQTKDHVALVSEANQTTRIIRIGGAHGPGAMRQWMGDSVGRWEGRTLVVETINFHPRQTRFPKGAPETDTRVVERFTRTSPTELHYAFEVENPALYTRPWKGEMILRPSRGRIFEYACHEGNYALANILAGGRTADAEAASKTAAGASGSR